MLQVCSSLISQEIADRDKPKRNMLMVNIPELTSMQTQERKETDQVHIDTILEKLCIKQDVCIMQQHRLGNIVEDKSSEQYTGINN